MQLIQRSGYRNPDWQTRAGTVALRIPKLLRGAYFPPSWSFARGGSAWLARAAARAGLRLQVPDGPPEDPYMNKRLPV